jgi:hypothetical protein
MPILFGVFLYLGITNLISVQFTHQILLFFIPQKYYPDMKFCRSVSMWAMHAYTLFQIVCFAIVYTVKLAPNASMSFPFVLALVACARYWFMPKVFSQKTLAAVMFMRMLF